MTPLDLGFPLWLRITHFLNILFITLLIRSGLQILADHPRLYLNDHSTPGSEWLKFGRKKMPKDELWTSLDEAEAINPVLGITGGRHNLGAARRWHFLTAACWILNGLVYLTLLFSTGEWRRLVPTDLSIFSDAWRTALGYLTFHIPPLTTFHPYDPLQQLTYASVVFIFSPLMILTGLAMSPAVAGRFPGYLKLFHGRQTARSLHFLGLVFIIVFVVIHLSLAAIVYGRENILNITLGNPLGYWPFALAVLSLGLLFIILFNVWATWYTLGHQRKVQAIFDWLLDRLTGFGLSRLTPHESYRKEDISPYFTVNGRPPKLAEYQALADRNFSGWSLDVTGLVLNPLSLSLDDLKNLPKAEQITKHNCVQGWSAVAEWGGVPLKTIMALAKPKPQARYALFHSYEKDESGQEFYETFSIKEILVPQTILAYEMNWAPLTLAHGAPLRLRVENKLGYKMVKFLRSIEFIEDYKKVGLGRGGYKEDYELFDRVAAI